MIPIKFPESNAIFAENQPEYRPIHVCINTSLEGYGEVVSCWRLSFRERLRLLFTGRMWMSLTMFGKPLTPSLLSTKKSDVLVTKKTDG